MAIQTRLAWTRAAVLFACALAPAWAAAQSRDSERAYREGYDEGFRRGYERGQRDAQAQVGNPPPGAVLVPVVPKRGIVVLRAWYGDGERRACELTGWAARRFNGRTSESVEVTNQICGDPAPGQRKELTVEYMCGGETRKESAYEHRRLSLSCY